MYDIIVRERVGVEGFYTFIAKIPAGSDTPEGMKKIARRLTESEANKFMNQYPQATRAKC